jgi:hypothetical protein
LGDYRGMPDPSDTPIAFELQARFASGEAWITLGVSAAVRAAKLGALSCARDVWGRVPTETRVVAIRRGRGAG